MVWIEEKSGVKFVCWGKKKDSLSDEEAFVVPDGQRFEADIQKIDVVKNEDDEREDFKYRLAVKGEDAPVILWSNAAIKRQHEALDLKEGEHVMFHYDGDYKTQYGKKGRNIRVSVDRQDGNNGKKKKK